MPNYKNINDKPHRSLLSIVLSAIGGFVISGSIYGAGLWGALLVLREADAIDNIVAYRYCLLIGLIYFAVRGYDKQMFSKK